MEVLVSMDRRFVFLIFFNFIFSNKSFNFKMTDLTFSGESNFKSEENIKITYLEFLYFIAFSALLFLCY